MSVSSQIDRIESKRNIIRQKLVELGIATSSDNIDLLAEAILNFSLDLELSEQSKLISDIENVLSGQAVGVLMKQSEYDKMISDNTLKTGVIYNVVPDSEWGT